MNRFHSPVQTSERRHSILRIFLVSLLGLGATALFSGCAGISYVMQAGWGQLSLYNHERPLNEVIKDPRTTDQVRERLKWVPEIKSFVEAELGVKATSNYTTYVDVKRPYVIWSLTVAEPYEVKLKTWSFPIVGSFPYLGFFKQDTASEWEDDYKNQGFDTYVRGVRAYSTLGYLRDPLLSTMLSRYKRDMVNLIFHETAHGHVFIKGQGSFNEQAASFVGDYGELDWLIKTYGPESPEAKDWTNERADRREMGKLLRGFADELKVFYASSAGWDSERRSQAKQAKFREFQDSIRRGPPQGWKGKGMATESAGRWASIVSNNAALLAYLTYEDEQAVYDLLNEKCGGRLVSALRYLKSFSERWSGPVPPQQALREELAAPRVACD